MANAALTLDDLIYAYLRFKEWMDYDEAERSAYCAKEVMVLQQLFGTSYVLAPANLATASYEQLLAAMEGRRIAVSSLYDTVNVVQHDAKSGVSDDEFSLILAEVDKTTFRSEVRYFMTLHQAIWQAVKSATVDIYSGSGEIEIDDDPIQDHFAEVDDESFDEIRDFIISEHPGIESLIFSVERAYELGLPKTAPGPMNHAVH